MDNDNEIKLHVGHKGMQLRNEISRCRDAGEDVRREQNPNHVAPNIFIT